MDNNEYSNNMTELNASLEMSGYDSADNNEASPQPSTSNQPLTKNLQQKKRAERPEESG